jgi:hypothetical protein
MQHLLDKFKFITILVSPVMQRIMASKDENRITSRKLSIGRVGHREHAVLTSFNTSMGCIDIKLIFVARMRCCMSSWR